MSPPVEGDLPVVDLAGTDEDFELAWKAFTLMEATGWSHPPFTGGWMDQPELLLENLFKIASLTRAMRKMKDDR